MSARGTQRRTAGVLAVVLLAVAFLGVVAAIFPVAPVAAQEADCLSDEEMRDAANAIVLAEVVDVRTGGSSTAGNEQGDDSIVVDILAIEKGGAQNPLAVFYPGEELPDIAAGTELDILVTYDIESARAESSLTCGFTVRSDGDALLGGASSGDSLGETAGETLSDAVRTAGLAGAAVIAATFVWRVFREFRPRLS